MLRSREGNPMIEKIDKILGVIFNILKVILIVLLISMVCILIAHIWFRYVLNNSLTWSEELLKILLVWFGMLSVAVLAARREHVAIVIFKNKMPKPLSKECSVITQVLTVVICIVGIVLGIKYCQSSGFRLTPALRIPYGRAYASIPVAFFFVAIFELRNLLVDLTGKGDYACIEKPEDDLSGGAEVEL